MLQAARTKLGIENLGAQRLKVLDNELPEMENIVAREFVPLLDHNHMCSQQCALDGGSQTAGT